MLNTESPGPKRPSKRRRLLFALLIGLGAILVVFFVGQKLDQPSPVEDSKNKVMNSARPRQLRLEVKKQEEAEPAEDQAQPDAGLEPEINWNKDLKRQLQEMEKKHKRPGLPASPKRQREEEWEPGPPSKKEIPPELKEKTKD